MKIIFESGREMPYINAYSVEKDYKDGYTRPSIQVEIPETATSFDELYSLMGTDFMLVGDADEEGVAPVTEWDNYSIKGAISLNDNVLTFKCYQYSTTEVALAESEQTIDELLLIIADGGTD